MSCRCILLGEHRIHLTDISDILDGDHPEVRRNEAKERIDAFPRSPILHDLLTKALIAEAVNLDEYLIRVIVDEHVQEPGWT